MKMQTTILNWLVGNLPLFGLRAQNWMVLLLLLAALYAFFIWGTHRARLLKKKHKAAKLRGPQ
jgi:hypothetical protein